MSHQSADKPLVKSWLLSSDILDEADGLRLLRHDPWLAVGALLIAQQLLVLHGDMAGFHGLTLAPAHPAAGARILPDIDISKSPFAEVYKYQSINGDYKEKT